MWVEAEHFENWQVWTGDIWPTDEGVPDRGACAPGCRVIRRVLPWEGPPNPSPELAARIEGMLGKTACWMYHVIHGSHNGAQSPEPTETFDRARRAAGERE